MPLPQILFEDHNLGHPQRQPVAVRFACLIADWSPGLLAEIVGGPGEYPPLLTVYEFDPTTGHVGEVRRDAYAAIRALKAPLPETLAAIPANHFVWSDDLVIAFSEYIDLTIGRESANEEGEGLRWNPALGDCATVVAAAADFSMLNKPAENRTYVVNGVRSFEFEGTTVQVKDSLGLRYVGHLIFHPGRKFSVTQLDRIANPPPPGADPEAPEIVDAVAISSDGEEDLPDVLHVVDPYSDTGVPLLDPAMIANVRTELNKLKESKEDAVEFGNVGKAEQIDQKMQEIASFLIAARDKRGNTRRLGSDAEKIRKSVGAAIARAIDRLRDPHPSLAKHLSTSINTGGDCEYRPSPPVRWSS